MNLSSYQNQHLQLARRVRDGRERSLILIEGTRLVAECLASGLDLKMAFTLRSSSIAGDLVQRGCPVYEVDEKLITSLSDTVTSQGVIVIAGRPEHSLEKLLDSETAQPHLVVALDRIQDPGNAGTIVRTAEAAGATGFVGSAGTVDLFSTKALRASMGSAFRLPIVTGIAIAALVDLARRRGLRVTGTASDGEDLYSDFDWRAPTLLLLGNEAGGLPPETLAACDAVLRIPLAGPVESINVASAGAVVLFEASRQRRMV
jgi:RNA methyltransferase, TrmH family